MDERQAFVRAIIDEPENDDLRLVFADWLEENGEGERAEFIRVQCEIERLFPDYDTSLPPRGETYRQLAEVAHRLWRSRVWPDDRDRTPGIEYAGIACLEDRGRPFACYRRGFVDGVCCTLAEWVLHGQEFCRAYPLRPYERMITDRVPFPSAEYRGYFRWFSTSAEGNNPSDVPAAIFDLMASTTPPEAHYPGEDQLKWFFSTPEEARLALARACIAWARSE